MLTIDAPLMQLHVGKGIARASRDHDGSGSDNLRPWRQRQRDQVSGLGHGYMAVGWRAPRETIQELQMANLRDLLFSDVR